MLSETGLSFGWFEWGCVEFFLKVSIAKITQMCVLACRLELKWS